MVFQSLGNNPRYTHVYKQINFNKNYRTHRNMKTLNKKQI